MKNTLKNLFWIVIILMMNSSALFAEANSQGAKRVPISLTKQEQYNPSTAPRSLSEEVICYYDIPTEIVVESYVGEISFIKLISIQTGHILLESPLSSTATVLIPEGTQDWTIRGGT